jgi:hypothetical protein
MTARIAVMQLNCSRLSLAPVPASVGCDVAAVSESNASQAEKESYSRSADPAESVTDVGRHSNRAKSCRAEIKSIRNFRPLETEGDGRATQC